MAESAVSFLIEYLGPLLVGEAKLLKGVRDEARKIKDELEQIRSFLRDADAKEDSNESLKTWVKQLREVSYDTEDVLDDFILRVPQYHSNSHGVLRFLQKCAHSIKRLRARHQIASDIQNIQTRLQHIKMGRDTYALSKTEEGSTSNNSNNEWSDPRINSLFIEESELVGIDKPRIQLMEWLIGGESKLSVISVVGMGGLGKTTLVRKIYNEKKKHFDTYAWVNVSQAFRCKDLLKNIISQLCEAKKEAVPEGMDAMDDIKLIETSQGLLSNKSHLLVLDDVWSTSVWDFLKNALLASSHSKVILTTRREDVASSCCIGTSDHIYHLQPLEDEEAWSLFCVTAFKLNQGKGCCPPEFEKLARSFVKKCEGLPLAIATLGGVLRDKTYAQWEEMSRSLRTYFENDEKLKNLQKILLFSFNDLPYYLKTCFLYLSIFPEDYDLRCVKLTHLWIAEGFIERKQDRSLEEVAEGHLRELINRGLIQPVEWTSWGKVVTCRVHDLLHDIIISKAKEQNFFTSLGGQNRAFCDKIRRLAIYSNVEFVTKYRGRSNLRSLFFFGVDKLSTSFVKASFSPSRLLKVVDLKNVTLESFPDELTSLFHLRYLSLKNTKIKTVPKSLGNLRNLETLNLAGTFVHELPVEILKLHRLRHLKVYHLSEELCGVVNDGGVQVPAGIGSLRLLQTLTCVEADSEGGIVRELKNLTQLRRLAIFNFKSADGKHLCTSMEKMRQLRSLIVVSMNEENVIKLHSLMDPPPLLQRLHLHGHLEKLPQWIFILQNLVKIGLVWSRLREDPLKLLQSLPNLSELLLWKAYDREELCCEAGGYPKLKLLSLGELSEMKNLRVEKGAMASLETLGIAACEALVEIPSCLQYLSKLKELHLFHMPEVLKRRIQRDGGEDRWKVEHIPAIKWIDTPNDIVEQI